jgi:hypothetical protein
MVEPMIARGVVMRTHTPRLEVLWHSHRTKIVHMDATTYGGTVKSCSRVPVYPCPARMVGIKSEIPWIVILLKRHATWITCQEIDSVHIVNTNRADPCVHALECTQHEFPFDLLRLNLKML